jgi:hypothetical protein
MQPGTADTERVVEALIGSGRVAVDRDREVVYAQLRQLESEAAQTSGLGRGALHVGRLHDAVLPAHTSEGVTATIERSHQQDAASSPLSGVSSRYS